MMPSFHSEGTLPVTQTLVKSWCRMTLDDMRADFSISGDIPDHYHWVNHGHGDPLRICEDLSVCQ